MGTDRCEEDDGVVGVAERTAGSQVVSGGSGRRCDADAVCLHCGVVFVIAEYLKSGHC